MKLFVVLTRPLKTYQNASLRIKLKIIKTMHFEAITNKIDVIFLFLRDAGILRGGWKVREFSIIRLDRSATIENWILQANKCSYRME